MYVIVRRLNGRLQRATVVAVRTNWRDDTIVMFKDGTFGDCNKFFTELRSY